MELVLVIEDIGVVGEQDEQQPDQHHFEVVAAVPCLGELLMKLPHEPRGLGVRRRLAAVELRLDAKNKPECVEIGLEVLEQESPLAVLLQIEQVPALEVAGQDVARAVALQQPVIIIERLVARLAQVQSRRLLLDDQGARPEQVDEALLVAGQVADTLLVSRDLTAADAEAIEEFVVECLGFALLVTCILVLLGKGGGAGADFGPLETHYPQLRRGTGVRQWRSERPVGNLCAGGFE